MKKLLLFLFLSSACIPRKVLKKELDIEKFQQNLRKLYDGLSTSEVKGSYNFKATNFNLSGQFRMVKKEKEWILVLQNPINPSIIKVNEDTLPIKDILFQDWESSRIKYEILGNSIKLHYKDSLVIKIETINSLPYQIYYDGITAILTHSEGKLKQIKIQSDEGILDLKLIY